MEWNSSRSLPESTSRTDETHDVAPSVWRLIVFVTVAASAFSFGKGARAGLLAVVQEALARHATGPGGGGVTLPSMPSTSESLPISRTPLFSWGFEQVDPSSGGAELAGFVSQNLWIDTSANWLGAQIRIELDCGSIYQDDYHGLEFTSERPAEALVERQPSLRFDTYVGRSDGGGILIAGGAANLGGAREPSSDDEVFHIAWATLPTDRGSGYLGLGRFTLSADAAGRAAVLLSAGGDGYEMVTHLVEIENGRLSPGEPFFHGLARGFEPLPPPPSSPEPLILQSLIPQDPWFIEKRLGVYQPYTGEIVPYGPGVSDAHVPEPSPWAIVVLLVPILGRGFRSWSRG